MLTEKYSHQLKAHGLSQHKVLRQLEIFKQGIPFVEIVEPASLENGIEVLSEEQQNFYANLFNSEKDNLDLLKFVPASGAATRMFQFLHSFLDSYKTTDDINVFLQKEENMDLKLFFESIEKFPFYHLVLNSINSKLPDYKKFGKGEQFRLFVQEMLEEDGLNYNQTPKGLIPFHKYDDNYVTAFGEQLYEAAFYATSNGLSKLHFTVSEEHKKKFKKRHEEIQHFIENRTGIKYNISYSYQKQGTDTIAVTTDNDIFLDENGNLLFRPSGHGALLENLNDTDADVVFIKNIDNVVSEKYIEKIAFQKKVLAGKLISLQQTIFKIVEHLKTTVPSEDILNEAYNFVSEDLKLSGIKQNKEELLKILERPIRVCGVVENTGAPGGGPFFIRDKAGNISLQIIEMSQIDMNDPKQKFLVDKATHFNPVDLVCGIRNYKGEKYNLLDFADPDSGFISEKSHQGKPIKALELPGLWNGAMHNWNTVFVEVPQITFNPVKTVNDLLNEVHQSK